MNHIKHGIVRTRWSSTARRAGPRVAWGLLAEDDSTVASCFREILVARILNLSRFSEESDTEKSDIPCIQARAALSPQAQRAHVGNPFDAKMSQQHWGL